MSLATISVDTATALAREYVGGGPRAALGDGPRVLPRSADELTREFGPDLWERVASDPKVASCLGILCDAAVGDGPTLTPAIAASNRKPADPADAPSAEDVAEARRIARFCEWNLARLDEPVDRTLKALLEGALIGGCKLAEMVYEDADYDHNDGTGPAPVLALKAIKVKPRDAWSFAVDRFWNVLGIEPSYDGTAGHAASRRVVPREKFAILTWAAPDRDPRGTSACRVIYEPWNLKTRLYPEYYQYTQTFASPYVTATYAGSAPDHDRSIAPGFDLHGRATITTAEYLAWQLEHFGNGRYLVAPDGTVITVHQPQGKGDPFLAGFQWCDDQIVAGLLGATRLTQEAQHGSKADSGTAQDVVGLKVTRVQALVRRLVEWDVLWNLTRLNYGRDKADRLTPAVNRKGEQQDFGVLAAVLTMLNAIGAIQPQMLPAIVNLFGLDIPAPDPGAAQEKSDVAALGAAAAQDAQGQPPADANQPPQEPPA